MCCQREWCREIGPSDKIPHDFLFAARAAEEGGFYQMNEELCQHRIHGKNTGKEEYRLKSLLNKERKLMEIKDYYAILQAFQDEEILHTEHARNVLESKLDSIDGRRRALESGSIVEVLRNAWKYKHNTRFVTAFCDVLIVKE